MGPDNYKLIVTIVNKGRAGKIVDATHLAGASGGTIIPGHGTAVRLLLGIKIEPEKEILLTIVTADKAKKVFDTIVEVADLNRPHSGIVFCLSVDQVAGIQNGVD
jgi:nitrogen regulatory protein PII